MTNFFLCTEVKMYVKTTTWRRILRESDGVKPSPWSLLSLGLPSLHTIDGTRIVLG